MKKSITIYLIILFASSPALLFASDQAIETCVYAIEKEKKGDLVKLEALDVKGKSVYEFETRDANGFEYEFMCDASGKIIEREAEVSSPNAMAFKKHTKIIQEDAIKIALESYPGTVKEIEYELESDGSPSYEIDIIGQNGTETKVEIDAATGKIIEVSTEKWEIGIEDDEKH